MSKKRKVKATVQSGPVTQTTKCIAWDSKTRGPVERSSLKVSGPRDMSERWITTMRKLWRKRAMSVLRSQGKASKNGVPCFTQFKLA
jgi:hypothetical protein